MQALPSCPVCNSQCEMHHKRSSNSKIGLHDVHCTMHCGGPFQMPGGEIKRREEEPADPELSARIQAENKRLQSIHGGNDYTYPIFINGNLQPVG
jgi:hypothetical protein